VGQRAPAIVGEKDWMLKDKNGDKKTLAWDASITAADLKNLEGPPNFNSTYIVRFRELLDKAPELNLYIETLKAVEIEQSKVESFVRPSGEGEEIVQPVFASELKALMHAYMAKIGLGARESA